MNSRTKSLKEWVAEGVDRNCPNLNQKEREKLIESVTSTVAEYIKITI